MLAAMEHEVFAHSGQGFYPEEPPFSPCLPYPEYEFGEPSQEPNPAYDAVRGCFYLAGLDRENFDKRAWNPLGQLMQEGETVLLKPNLVKEVHPRDPGGWRYVLTHGSIIRAVADYVFRAVGRRGRVILGDAPQTDSSFSAIAELLGLGDLREFYAHRGFDFQVVDFRQEEWVNSGGVIVERRKLAGDPNGYVAFDLAGGSEFSDHWGAGRYYGADYDLSNVNHHHSGGRHEYLISGSAIQCDVLFSLPKLKTHKKAGITVSLKNLVGVNGDKNWLPHHTEGHPANGGDEYPERSAKHLLERRALATLRRFSLTVPGVGTALHRAARKVGRPVFGDTEDVVRNGNWWGNETIWRMCLDLNKIILYGSPDGTLRKPLPQNRKRHFVLVDGLIAGEGRGPMNPDPVTAGLVLFGTHPPSVDAACAWLMGFDPEKIPIVRQAFRCHAFPLAEHTWRDVSVLSNRTDWCGRLPDIADVATLHFQPHFGWTNRIERHSVAHVEA
jgi:uncharacterized protein (DUF362 family)